MRESARKLGEPVRALAELEPALIWYEERHADIEVVAAALFAKDVDREEVMRWLVQHPRSH